MDGILKGIFNISNLLKEPIQLIFVIVVLCFFIIVWWQYKIILMQGDYSKELTKEMTNMNSASTELITLLRILVNRG